ncbi:aldo/keto reductase [Pseudactinotalea sp. Z1748]|uniref:aldo/keto reductase n=1 Tax=Pseudactinotalea sp. Z1748 TaxID=3413027 RepID=UPI003C79CD50
MAQAQTGSEGDTYGRQGFGSMRLSEDDAGTADRDPVAVLNAALDLGITIIDTATGHDATIGQVALAWVHHRQQEHGVRVVPLPGTASVRHLHANVAAADLRLSATDLRRLETITAAAKA